MINKEFSLCIPCALVKFTKKKVLIDSYFIGKLDKAYRNALLLYPPLGFTHECHTGDNLVLERRILGVEDIQSTVIEVVNDAQSHRLKRSRELFIKHRISLFFPTKLLEKRLLSPKKHIGSDEWEVNGALAIIYSIFGDINPAKITVNSVENNIFVKVDVKKKDDNIFFESRNQVLEKNYSWLYANDSGFQKEINDLLYHQEIKTA